MPETWYRMHDAEPNGVVPVAKEDARNWNAKGFGIFKTVNEFKTAERRIANLQRICAWAVDMDAGSKKEQLEKIRKSPLVPSSVVETKRGFQCYWRAKNAKPEHWNAIVLERLVPYFGADKNARDMARILRVPGFYHLKNPAEPFLVREVWSWDVAYHEEELARAFKRAGKPPEPPERTAERAHAAIAREQRVHGDDFWDRVWSMDCERGLERLSGHAAVRGELYTFKPVSNGNKNILVNGKGTSCWIDKAGRIGSLDKGGPTMATWLRWFGHSWSEVVRVLKAEFPELTR